MPRVLAPVLIIGGSALVIAMDWFYDPVLLGAGCAVMAAGIALGVLQRPGPLTEKLTAFAGDVEGALPAGGAGGTPTPRSAVRAAAYVAATALCWIAFFLLGGDVRGSTLEFALACAGVLLLALGWLERLSRIWGPWRTAAYVAAMPLCFVLLAPLSDVLAGGAFAALLLYGVWTWPGG